MEDSRIVALYWARNEEAIARTQEKYGAFCLSVARNLLSQIEDAEECVNDAYREAWDSMPTQRPERLRPWLGRVVRNLSIDRWRRDHAKKRYAGMELLLSELEDCVPAPDTAERTLEAKELGAVIGAWLQTLREEDRTLFLRRYWNGEALNDLAREFGIPAAKLAQRMLRLRRSLKAKLEQEGIGL